MTRARLGVTVSAVATLLCAACSSVSSTAEAFELTIAVQGTITDLDTGLPVDSVFVEVRTTTTGGFAEAYSDSTGLYSFSFVYRFFAGELFCPFLVFVRHDDYLEDFFSLTCIEELQTVNIQMEVF